MKIKVLFKIIEQIMIEEINEMKSKRYQSGELLYNPLVEIPFDLLKLLSTYIYSHKLEQKRNQP